jgi:hypothetical protein
MTNSLSLKDKEISLPELKLTDPANISILSFLTRRPKLTDDEIIEVLEKTKATPIEFLVRSMIKILNPDFHLKQQSHAKSARSETSRFDRLAKDMLCEH